MFTSLIALSIYTLFGITTIFSLACYFYLPHLAIKRYEKPDDPKLAKYTLYILALIHPFVFMAACCEGLDELFKRWQKKQLLRLKIFLTTMIASSVILGALRFYLFVPEANMVTQLEILFLFAECLLFASILMLLFGTDSDSDYAEEYQVGIT